VNIEQEACQEYFDKNHPVEKAFSKKEEFFICLYFMQQNNSKSRQKD